MLLAAGWLSAAWPWDEAVETLRLVMENSQDKLLAVTERRYVGLRDYCHLQLATLPTEALELYRSRVDPVAGGWYEEGVGRRDRRPFRHVWRCDGLRDTRNGKGRDITNGAATDAIRTISGQGAANQQTIAVDVSRRSSCQGAAKKNQVAVHRAR